MAHDPAVNSVIDLKSFGGMSAFCGGGMAVNVRFLENESRRRTYLFDLSQFDFDIMGDFRKQHTRLGLDVLVEQQLVCVRHVVGVEILLFANIVQPIVALNRR